MVPAEDLSEKDKELVDLCNKLLVQFNITIRVKTVEDISASIFVTLCEGLFGEPLTGIIRKPVTQEDEIENCQIVIDSLSNDVLHTPLTHIRAPEIITHTRDDIYNLLEIFQGLSEYILTRIETVSSDGGDVQSVDDMIKDQLNDPDLVTSDIIDNILDEELSKNKVDSFRRNGSPINKTDYINNYLQNTERSPGLDSTGELIREGEKWEAKMSEQYEKDGGKLNEFADIGRRDPNSQTYKLQDAQRPPTSDLNTEFRPMVGRYSPPSRDRHPSRKIDRLSQRVESDDVRNCNTDVRHTFTHHLYHHYNTVNTGGDLSNGTSVASQYVDLDHHPSRLKSSQTKLSSKSDHVKPDRPAYKTHSQDSSLSASLPVRLNPQPQMNNKLRATIATSGDYKLQREDNPLTRQYRDTSSNMYDTRSNNKTGYNTQPRQDYRRFDNSDLPSSSYDDLQNLVQSTAALARTAVRTSPVRTHADPSYTLTPPRHRTTRPEYKYPVVDDQDLSRDINHKTRTSRHLANANISSNSSNQSPSFLRRKVSFMDDRSSTDSGSPRHFPRSGAPNVSLDLKRKQQRQQSSRPTVRSQPSNKYGSYTDIGYLSDKELESDTGSDSVVHKRFEEIIDDVLSTDSDPMLATRKKRIPTTKQVHFDKILNKTGKTALAATRNQLKKETKKGDKRTEYLKKIYAEDYDDYLDEVESDLRNIKEIVIETDKNYKKKMSSKAGRKPSVSSKSKVKKVTGVHKVPLNKPVSTKVRKCSSSSSGILPRKMLTVHDEEALLPVLLDEFPHLHMSQNTWHELMRKGLTQIENITKAYEESTRKKSKSQQQIEEAVRRHEILTSLVRKQMESTNRVREAKEQKKQQLQFKNKIHEKRQQSARARKYYNEYAVRARSKLLRRRTKEEMIFKKLFQDGLSIQKERIRDIRQYSREQRSKEARIRQDELDSMENYYHDQFEMLAAKVATEREELIIREKSQQKVLDQMKKELRKKMEKEIQGYQDQMFRDDDEAYFRHLDADRLRQELHLAKYQSRV